MDQTLAQRIRTKYPSEYDDLDDVTLESKVLVKYPEYADLPRTVAGPPRPVGPTYPEQLFSPIPNPKKFEAGESFNQMPQTRHTFAPVAPVKSAPPPAPNFVTSQKVEEAEATPPPSAPQESVPAQRPNYGITGPAEATALSAAAASSPPPFASTKGPESAFMNFDPEAIPEPVWTAEMDKRMPALSMIASGIGQGVAGIAQNIGGEMTALGTPGSPNPTGWLARAGTGLTDMAAWVSDAMPSYEYLEGKTLAKNPEIMRDPRWWSQTLSQGLGSALGFAAAYAAGAGPVSALIKTGQIAPKLMTVGKWAPKIRALFTHGAGAVTGGTFESGVEAGGVYLQNREQGSDHETASAMAANTFKWNIALNVGLAAAGYAIPKALNWRMVNRAWAGAFGEGTQEVAQQLISNRNTGRPPWEGVHESALVGFLMGLGFGLIPGGAHTGTPGLLLSGTAGAPAPSAGPGRPKPVPFGTGKQLLGQPVGDPSGSGRTGHVVGINKNGQINIRWANGTTSTVEANRVRPFLTAAPEGAARMPVSQPPPVAAEPAVSEESIPVATEPVAFVAPGPVYAPKGSRVGDPTQPGRSGVLVSVNPKEWGYYAHVTWADGTDEFLSPGELPAYLAAVDLQAPEAISGPPTAAQEAPGAANVVGPPPLPPSVAAPQAQPVPPVAGAPQQPAAKTEVQPPATPADVEAVGGEYVQVDANAINLDPKTYQFKESDAKGETGKLRNVEEWDELSGKTTPVLLHERLDGQLYVADGHQRVNLAQRLLREGKPVPKLNAIVLKESDGYTAKDVRTASALINVRQDTASPIDIAKLLREGPLSERDLASIPKGNVHGERFAQAQDLAKLGDQAFQAVVNGELPANYARAVGRHIADPKVQMMAIRELAKADLPNAYQAERFIKELLSEATTTETQVDLFGEETRAVSLAKEKAQVLDAVRRSLTSQKSAFANALHNASKLEGAGNVLNTAANERMASDAVRFQALLESFADKAGATQNALREAARRVHAGEIKPADAVDTVVAALEQDFRGGKESPGGPTNLRGGERAGRDVGPGPGSEAEGDVVPPTRAELEAAGQGSMFGAEEPAALTPEQQLDAALAAAGLTQGKAVPPPAPPAAKPRAKKSTPPPAPGPSKYERIKAELQAEKADLGAKLLRDMGMYSGIDPTLIPTVVKLLVVYTKQGVNEFTEVVRQTVELIGEIATRKLGPTLDAAWGQIHNVKVSTSAELDRLAPPKKPESVPPPAPPAADATADALKAAGLVVTPRSDGLINLSGNTFVNKALIAKAGGLYNGNKTWRIPTSGLAKLAAELGRTPGDRQSPGHPGTRHLENSAIRELRRAADERADEGIAPEPAGRFYSDATRALIFRGEGAIPTNMLEEQVEDVARIVRAFEAKKPMFLLASEPGSGKTYVLGGAIRELKARGAKKIVYVTLRKELITQAKKDLSAFGIEGVEFLTYPMMRKTPPSQPDAIIFDEAHSIKNVEEDGAAQAKAAAAWIKNSGMTVFASATPFENPVQAKYLQSTGVFDPIFGSFRNFALAFGASAYKTQNGNEIIEWSKRPTNDADSAAARRYLMKAGMYTSRRIRLPEGQVDARLAKVEASAEDEIRYRHFTNSADTTPNVPWNSKAWVKNFQKRLLEASKLEQGMIEAEAALARGRFPIIFVETKAERRIDIPYWIEEETRWREDSARLRSMGDRTPPRSQYGRDKDVNSTRDGGLPPEGIVQILSRYMDDSGESVIMIPSAEDVIQQRFGEDKVAVFTGSVSPVQAAKNLAAWRSGEKPLLTATMAKGGAGMSLQDLVGDHQTTQININLPWTATGVVQVAQRSARYGLKGKAETVWLFANNIPFDRELGAKVGGRMADMGAVVHGERPPDAGKIENFDIKGQVFSEDREILNAIQKPSAAEVDARQRTENGQPVGEGNALRQETPGARQGPPAPQEAVAPPPAPRSEDIGPGGIQPRLPGAEGVREQNIKTPEFDLPVALSQPRQALADKLAELKLQQDMNFADMGKDLSKLGMAEVFDPAMIAKVTRIVANYVQQGVVNFQDIVLKFREDYRRATGRQNDKRFRRVIRKAWEDEMRRASTPPPAAPPPVATAPTTTVPPPGPPATATTQAAPPASGRRSVPPPRPDATAGEVLAETPGMLKSLDLYRNKAISKDQFAANIRLAKYELDDTTHHANAIRMAVESNPTQFEEERRGVISHSETLAEAENIVINPAALNELLNRPIGTAVNNAEVTATRLYVAQLSDEAATAAEATIQDDTPDNWLKLTVAEAEVAKVVGVLSGRTAEAGRALNAFKIDIDHLVNGISRWEQVALETTSPEMYDRAIAMRNLLLGTRGKGLGIQSLTRIALDPFKQKKFDILYTVWLSGIVSGLRTHKFNLAGNALVFASIPVELGASATVDAARAFVTRTPRERFFGEITAFNMDTDTSIARAIDLAHQAWTTERSSFDDQGLWAREHGLQLQPAEIPKTWTKAQRLAHKAYRLARHPLIALLAEDELNKSLAYDATLRVLAYREAMKAGLKGKGVTDYIRSRVQDPSLEMKKVALREARYRTFSLEVGPIGQVALYARKKIPGLRYIIPFVTTGANMARYGVLERTILRIPYQAARNYATKASPSGPPLWSELGNSGKLSDEIAMMSMAVGATGAIVSLMVSGLLGGMGNPDERDMDEVEGRPRYWLRIPGGYFQFNRLEPVSSIVGLTVDFAEAVVAGKTLAANKLFDMIVKSFGNNINDKSFNKGLVDFIRAIDSGQGYRQSWANTILSSFIPNIMAQTGQAFDRYGRRPQTLKEALLARIPGMTDSVPYRVDIWGNPIPKEGSPLQWIAPGAISTAVVDTTGRELRRVGLTLRAPNANLTFTEDEKDDGTEGVLSPDGAMSLRRARGMVRYDAATKVIKSAEYRALRRYPDKQAHLIRNAMDSATRAVTEEAKNLLERQRNMGEDVPRQLSLARLIRAYENRHPDERDRLRYRGPTRPGVSEPPPLPQF